MLYTRFDNNSFFRCLKPLFSVANSINYVRLRHPHFLYTKPLLAGESAQINFMIIATYGFSEQLVQALELLNLNLYNERPLVVTLAETCGHIVAKHKNPKSAAICLRRLCYYGDLLTGDETQAVLDTVAAHEDPESLCGFIFNLYVSRIDTQANFIALAAHSGVLCHMATEPFWKKLSFPSMTQRHFDRIIQISEQYKTDPIAAAQALEEHLVGEGEEIEGRPGF